MANRNAWALSSKITNDQARTGGARDWKTQAVRRQRDGGAGKMVLDAPARAAGTETKGESSAEAIWAKARHWAQLWSSAGAFGAERWVDIRAAPALRPSFQCDKPCDSPICWDKTSKSDSKAWARERRNLTFE
ncbi:hypothetical protein AAKU55_003434 [Oxalobacteraceae bacterium GrIS 1.11]